MNRFKMLSIAVFAVLMSVNAAHAEDAKMIKAGSKVKFDYTLTVNGQAVDTSDGKQPIEYTQGDGSIVVGLSRQMEGMKVGESKSIAVSPEEGYGPVNPEAFREFLKTIFPADFDLKQGMVVEMQNEQGARFPAVVWEIKEDTVVLNFNHPLAGQDLLFDIKVVDIP